MAFHSVSLFLAASLGLPAVIGIAVAAIVIGALAGTFVGGKLLQTQREKKIQSAEAVIAKMKEEAE